MRTRNNKLARMLFPAILGATAAMAAAGAATLVADAAHGSVGVGDIIAFTPLQDGTADLEARIVVHRPDQFGCVLDLNTIRQTGGSLVVEARMSGEAHSYRAHWAGERTTSDSGDCGSNADLIVDHNDLDSLALAAGGYGVGLRRVNVFSGGGAN